jgi:hypothetical protein
MEQAQIGRREVLSILKDVGGICAKRISVYMVGGGAMALRGEKDATRDIDLILESQDEADEVKRSFEQLGFEVNARHPAECRSMVDVDILSKPTGLRADLFVGKVCNMLRFSEGMKNRATLVDELGNIVLYICSREDIFLLKSVTERTRDLDDMLALFRRGLSRDAILDECERQTTLSGLRGSQVWEAFLVVKIEEMESRYGVKVPWKRSLKAKAEVKMGAQHALAIIDKGVDTASKLAKDMDESPAFVGKCLRYLEETGEVKIDRQSKLHRIMPSGASRA